MTAFVHIGKLYLGTELEYNNTCVGMCLHKCYLYLEEK